ncbi:TRAP transporter small permease [Neomoorella humiferrea]|uniref:TRAP transporter small permease n=1 Tax=Neomoorella humiferrea TaxID=676965 RepID=UPI00348A15CF
MERLTNAINKVETFISTCLLSAIVVLVFFSSLMRYLGHPINGADTIAASFFVWLIYIASDQVYRKDRHLGVDFFVQRVPERMGKIIAILVHLFILVFLLVVTYYGMVLTIENNGRILGDLPISYALVATAIPVGTILMSLTAVIKILRLIGELRNPVKTKIGVR